MRPRVILASLLTLIQFAVVSLMIGAAVMKIVEFGVLDYVQHYTNWSWTLQTLFYLGTLPAPLIVALEIDDWRLDVMAGFIAVTFVPLWGIVSAVLLLVILMLISGSRLLETFATVIPISDIVLGNEVFHFFTVLLLLTWAVVNHRRVYYSLNQLFAHPTVRQNRSVFVALVLYQMFLGAIITQLFYASIFDPHAVYDTDIDTVLGVLCGLASLTLATSPLLFFLFAFYLGAAPLRKRFLIESEFEAASDRIVLTSFNKLRK